MRDGYAEFINNEFSPYIEQHYAFYKWFFIGIVVGFLFNHLVWYPSIYLLSILDIRVFYPFVRQPGDFLIFVLAFYGFFKHRKKSKE